MKKVICSLNVELFEDGRTKSEIKGNGLDMFVAYCFLTLHLIKQMNIEFVKAAFELALKKMEE